MQTTTNDAMPLDDLYTLQELAAAYPRILSVQNLRWQLRNRSENGLSHAVVRVGKNLLISKGRYEQWLASRAGKCAA